MHSYWVGAIGDKYEIFLHWIRGLLVELSQNKNKLKIYIWILSRRGNVESNYSLDFFSA